MAVACSTSTFHSISAWQSGACHGEVLRVIAKAEYLWLLSPAALNHSCVGLSWNQSEPVDAR